MTEHATAPDRLLNGRATSPDLEPLPAALLAQLVSEIKALRQDLARPQLERLTIGREDLAELLGVCVDSIDKARALGKLPEPAKFGGRLLWNLEEIRAWIGAGMPPAKLWATTREAAKRRAR